MMRASIRIKPETGAETLARALSPETDWEIQRAAMRISEQAGELLIEIEAEDIVAFRAAMNSYLRWTKLALDTCETAGVIQ